MRRAFIAAVAAIALLALAVPTASGHALLQSGDPAPNSVLKAAPAVVTLTFTEAPDPKLSSIRVLDSSGGLVTTASLSAVAGHPDELSMAMPPLPDGVYTVAWRTVSAVDGHIAAGSYAFSIGNIPPPSNATVTAPTVSSVTSSASTGVVIARWILYLGLLGLLGAAFLGSVLLRGVDMLLPLRLAVVELGVAVAGTVLLVGFQIGDAGASLTALPGTSLGNDAVLRLAPLVVAAGLLVAAIRASERARRALLAASGVLAALALLAEARLSHAASQSLAPAEIGVQWLHLVAVGLWLGGLAALLTELRGPAAPTRAELARRFAALAGLGLAAVALTGAVRAVVDVGSIDALVSTDFGRLVLLKIGLLMPIAVLGALNHFRNVPLAALRLGPLRRAGSIELALGAVVLIVSSMVVNIAPPTEVAAADAGLSASPAGVEASATPASLEVTSSDFGTTVRLRLTASPGTVGANEFRASLTDYDTGAPVDATAVRLSFSLPSRPDIGSSTLELARQATGAFVGTGANLSLEGTWHVSALVTGPTASVQIDLDLTVRTSRQQIDVNRVTGLPTIYTVHLGSGRTVQIYLDPGTPGPNLLHATWFDADGKEMPVSNVTMTELLVSGESLPLQPQILDSGHEAAPVQVTSLPVTFTVAAIGPGSADLQTQLQISQSL
jgi:copper transport protein